MTSGPRGALVSMRIAVAALVALLWIPVSAQADVTDDAIQQLQKIQQTPVELPAPLPAIELAPDQPDYVWPAGSPVTKLPVYLSSKEARAAMMASPEIKGLRKAGLKPAVRACSRKGRKANRMVCNLRIRPAGSRCFGRGYVHEVQGSYYTDMSRFRCYRT